MSRDALGILEADDWPGNVRELEAVVKRAMIRRRRGRVTPEDVILPKLQRQRLPEAVLALEPSLTPQRQALRLVSSGGEVRRGDLVACCGISREAARKELAGLVRVGAVRREGSGRGGDTYRPRGRRDGPGDQRWVTSVPPFAYHRARRAWPGLATSGRGRRPGDGV